MHNSLFLILFITSLAITQTTHARTLSCENTELISALGPGQMHQVGEWIQADIMVTKTAKESQSLDEFTTATCFYEFIEYTSALTAMNLIPQSQKTMTIIPEEKTCFNVIYYDAYNNMPSTGYPKVSYWSATLSTTSVSLEHTGQSGPGLLYRKEVNLDPGVYFYRYTVKNDVCALEYTLQTSSIVVTRRPAYIANLGAKDKTVTSTARVLLRWAASDPEGGVLSYKLYLGKEQSSLALHYQGSETSCELTNLDCATCYYWQVECINIHGATQLSPVYSLSTINTTNKLFNYPNPFNPHSQKTNFVFSVSSPQTIHFKIYSEYGDLQYETAYAAATGMNELSYDGRDSRGEILYNGSYICRVESNEGCKTCYLLIIK